MSQFGLKQAVKFPFIRLTQTSAKKRLQAARRSSSQGRPSLSIFLLTLTLSGTLFPLSASSQDWNSVSRYTTAFLGTNTGALPFSFRYSGVSSRTLLPLWNRTIQIETLDAHRQKATWRFTNSANGFSLRAEAIIYSNYPAVEWVLWFRNNGTSASPLIEDVRAHDQVITMSQSMAATLVYNEGTYVVPPTPNREEFKPAETNLLSGDLRLFEPYGGRPSDKVLPFFNVCGPDNKSGLFFGIGWTGQWSARFQRATSGSLTVRAGIKTMRTILNPGEEIRTPSILVMSWNGLDRDDGQNQFRRLLRDYYTPRIDGKPIVPPISAGPHAVIPFEQTTEANLLGCIQNISSRGVPVDNFWLDAGWYTCPNEPSGWDKTTGTWEPDPVRFPNGLRPIADAAKQNGMDFLVWFEPERVMPNTWLYNNRPEWLLAPADFLPERSYQAASNFRLLDFGNPAALAWAKTTFSDFVRTNGITIFRMDSNLHPILYWQNNEPTNRVGMRETKHVMGLYEFWDALVANNPGLKLDVCSGTGSRIDFEVMRRAMNLTRSDGAWWDPVSDQGITTGYAPWSTHTGVGTTSDDLYNFRSGMGAVFCANLNWPSTTDADWPRWKALLETVHGLREIYAGDFYPLTPWSSSDGDVAAWMYHRPESGQAVVQLFRRASNNTPNTTLYLRGLQTNQQYLIRNLDNAEATVKSGLEMMSNGLVLNLPTARSAGLWKIEPLPATNQNAGVDFWWSAKGNTNGQTQWVARGGATNANQWSYGVADLGGGSQPASLAATSGGPSGRGAFGNFRDLSMMKTNTAFTSNVLWLYRSLEGAEVGFFNNAWTNQAPGFDGGGAGRVTNPNTRYLWLRPAGSAGDGVAAALRYTAPQSREYRIRGEFVPGGDGSNTNNTQSFAILRSASNLDPTNRSQDAFLLPRTTVRDDGPVTSYDFTVSLRAGDTITWLVGTDGGTNAATGGNGNQMAVSAEVQQTLPPTFITLMGPTQFSPNGGAPYPQFQVTGSTSPAVLSFVGTGTTSYGPSTNPPSAAGTYRLTASVASDGTYGRGLWETDYSILPSWNAYSDFYLSPTAGAWSGATTPSANGGAWGYYAANVNGLGFPTQIGTYFAPTDLGGNLYQYTSVAPIGAGTAVGTPLWTATGGAGFARYQDTFGWGSSLGRYDNPWFDGAPGVSQGLSNLIWMQAGWLGGGANEGIAPVVTWKVPATGLYSFMGRFVSGNQPDNEASVAIVDSRGGTAPLSRTVLPNNSVTNFSFTKSYTAGDVVQFQVGSNFKTGNAVGLQVDIAKIQPSITNWNASRDFYLSPTAAGWAGATAPSGTGTAWGYYAANVNGFGLPTQIGTYFTLDGSGSGTQNLYRYSNVSLLGNTGASVISPAWDPTGGAGFARYQDTSGWGSSLGFFDGPWFSAAPGNTTEVRGGIWMQAGWLNGPSSEGIAPVVTWTAPYPGIYDFQGSFQVGINGPDAVNGATLAIVASTGSAPLPKTSATQGMDYPFAFRRILNQGDIIQFQVGTDNKTGAAVGLNADVTWIGDVDQKVPSAVIFPGSTCLGYSESGVTPALTVLGSSSTPTYSYKGVDRTTYGPSATPPTNRGRYEVTVTTADNTNWSSVTNKFYYSVGTFNAFKDFWWNRTNGQAAWMNPLHASAQGRSQGTPTSRNAWSYGLFNCTNKTITASNVNTTFEALRGASYDSNNTSWTYHNGDATNGTRVGWAAANSTNAVLALSPSAGVAGGDGLAAAVRWTAPAAGTYRFQGNFVSQASNSMSVAIHTVGSNVPGNTNLIGRTIVPAGTSQSFDLIRTVASNQTVTWVVGSDGSSEGDKMLLLANVVDVTGVTLQTPTITWTNPAAIPYGTAVSAVQLNALSSVLGTFTYSPTNGVVLNAGSYPLTAVFMPSDIGTYNSTTSTVTATISPATLEVTADAKQKTVGQANPAWTWQAAGWQGSDSSSLMTGSLSSPAGSTPQPGTYPIQQGTLSAGSNYTISFTPADFVVYQSFSNWSSNQTLTPDLFLKYAVGGASAPTQTSEAITPSLTGGSLSLLAVVRTNDPTLTLRGESADDLAGSWNTNTVSVTTDGVSQTNVPSGHERRRYSVDQGTGARRFLRLTIQR